MRKFFALALVAVTTSVASAAPVSLHLTNFVPATPTNRVVNNLAVNSSSDLQSLQMIVELTVGTIFQDSQGSNTAPLDLIVNGGIDPDTGEVVAPRPSLGNDTFMTIGGYLASQSAPVLLVGRAVNVPGSTGSSLTNTTARIDAAWSPGAGTFTGAVTNFPIARVTLSNTATGTARFYFTSNGEAASEATLNIVNGVIIPEPASAVMGALALCGLGAARRR